MAVPDKTGLGQAPSSAKGASLANGLDSEAVVAPVDGLVGGRFAGREAFQQTVRAVLSQASAEGWPEIILSDADFEDWPLGEAAVARHFVAVSTDEVRRELERLLPEAKRQIMAG